MINWKDEYGDIDPYEDDDKPAPSDYDGPLHSDERGNEYNPHAGSQSPTEGRCNALLKWYEQRYGEPRYCTALPGWTFGQDSDFCNQHKSREALMERHQELFEHGAWTQNYIYLLDKLSGPKKVYVVELFDDLLHDSIYSFDETRVEWEIDIDDVQWVEDASITTELPVPQQRKSAASALWMAALDMVRMQNMQEVIFDDGVESESVAATADDGGVITDKITESKEHHLNLPISRLTKDIEAHFERGGVTTDDEDATVEVDGREWHLNYFGDDDVEPEAVSMDLPQEIRDP
jgi:hypothetical protein